MIIRLEANSQVIGTEEGSAKVIESLFEHLTNTTCLMSDEIHVICYPVELWRTGQNGKPLKDVPSAD